MEKINNKAKDNIKKKWLEFYKFIVPLIAVVISFFAYCNSCNNTSFVNKTINRNVQPNFYVENINDGGKTTEGYFYYLSIGNRGELAEDVRFELLSNEEKIKIINIDKIYDYFSSFERHNITLWTDTLITINNNPIEIKILYNNKFETSYYQIISCKTDSSHTQYIYSISKPKKIN